MKGRKAKSAGPSLFDQDAIEEPVKAKPQPAPIVVPVAEPARLQERPAHVYKMSAEEEAAANVPIPERSRWMLKGEGVVEIRGTSPLMVWFSKPNEPATSQATRYRHEFLKRAVLQA